MDKQTFVAYGLDRMGIYPYPEITTPVMAIFEGNATKEQIDYIGKVTKPVKKKFSKLYDDYQQEYKGGTDDTPRV